MDSNNFENIAGGSQTSEPTRTKSTSVRRLTERSNTLKKTGEVTVVTFTYYEKNLKFFEASEKG
jgi:hypothetical protein